MESIISYLNWSGHIDEAEEMQKETGFKYKIIYDPGSGAKERDQVPAHKEGKTVTFENPENKDEYAKANTYKIRNIWIPNGKGPRYQLNDMEGNPVFDDNWYEESKVFT